MRHDKCLLTTKDFAMLESMLDRGPHISDSWRALLRRKVNSAEIVFRDDVPPDVVTLNSRVRFRVDDGRPEVRVLSHGCTSLPVGLSLPLTSPTGLALLGSRENQVTIIEDDEGRPVRIFVEKVLYQPEAAHREQLEAVERLSPQSRRSGFKVISGGLSPERSPRSGNRLCPGGSDDPGPSAA
ncbi:nucleoside-diphosphate kinase [Oricola thermophila]|uniref:Nucleoside-diphosphate kinase n=1 Tax=Oricola thermophila TaxID=2742145 RepID=A0A6N1VC25_9HYPH|nr:nucleoside-diphosphate kinase [Oricola thermophila]QKV18556.1 nucleoside-diphosphate kinase [Oricola thermophila]